jgi:hypothetical protein
MMPPARCRLELGRKRRSGRLSRYCGRGFEITGYPALYTVWKNVYKRKATAAEQLRVEVPVTQFGRMCQKLGIRIIATSSPQAKGRVEPINGVHQDRLIKKMRRRGIGSDEAANAYLEKEYLPEHNRRFSYPATSPEDYHGRKPTACELRRFSA